MNDTYKTKRYFYSYEDWEENNKNAGTMIEEIKNDPDLPSLEEIVIGCWGETWDENDGAQRLIDGIVEAKEKFSHIRSLFIGDMEGEECEVSWIIQGDYSKLWAALPNLEKLTIQGSSNLILGEISHKNLKELTIICGGLPAEVMKSIGNAKLPALEKLLLYIGIEDYGFDGDADTVREMLADSDFPRLTYLGITDSEIQDELTEVVLSCKYINQISALDLSMGTLTDKGGEKIYEALKKYDNIKYVDLQFHFMSDAMTDKLESIKGVEVNTEDAQEPEEYQGEIWYYAMLTE